jgi:hypothetical protein
MNGERIEMSQRGTGGHRQIIPPQAGRLKLPESFLCDLEGVGVQAAASNLAADVVLEVVGAAAFDQASHRRDLNRNNPCGFPAGPWVLSVDVQNDVQDAQIGQKKRDLR